MSSNFLDALLGGGPGYKVSFTSDGASVKPASNTDEALKAFQRIVSQIEDNEGYGYRIFNTHESSDRAGSRVDLVLIKFEDGGGISHVEEGRLAFGQGKDIHDCPYTYKPFKEAWRAGWFDAQETSGARR